MASSILSDSYGAALVELYKSRRAGCWPASIPRQQVGRCERPFTGPQRLSLVEAVGGGRVSGSMQSYGRSPLIARLSRRAASDVAVDHPLATRFWWGRARRYKWFTLIVVLPTLLTSIFCSLIVADRFVSEAQIVVRKASEPAPIGRLASILTTGLSSGGDDTSAVQAYIFSRDALASLGSRLPVKSYFDVAEADFLSRWPSWLYGRSDEEFYRYYKTMISAAPSAETGVMVLSVEAFDPTAARRMTEGLVDLAEEMVNRLNDRIRSDAIGTADNEVVRSQEALVASQIALTQFRNSELLLDPQQNAVLLTELIGKLSTELALTTAQIEQLRASAPNSPQLAPLVAQANSLQQQIASQRDEVSAGGAGLAEKVAQYERLTLHQQFATRRLASAVEARTAAQAEARRQQVFLQRIVEPNQPDRAMMPKRLAISLTVFGWSLLFYLLFWLIGSGHREEAAGG